MKITVWAQTNKVASKSETFFDIDEKEWNEMTEDDREDLCREYLPQVIEWGWKEAEKK